MPDKKLPNHPFQPSPSRRNFANEAVTDAPEASEGEMTPEGEPEDGGDLNEHEDGVLGPSPTLSAFDPRLDPGLARLTETAKTYARAARAQNTKRAYDADWRQFASWLRRNGFHELPATPQTVGLYLAAQAEAGVRVATLERRLSGICWRYRQLGAPLDASDRHVSSILAGIRRKHARPPAQKQAIFADELLAMLATLDMDLRGLRDRAILALGFAGALRRSEIVGLDCGPAQTEDATGWIEIFPLSRGQSADRQSAVGPPMSAEVSNASNTGADISSASKNDGGLLLTLNGKTGWREVEIGRGSRPETCPVALLETWMRLGRISHGPLFRPIARKNSGVSAERLSDKHVARLVQKCALAAGLRGDLSEGERKQAFSGHSLRAGLASSAQIEEAHVQKHLGHASAEMTRRYQRKRDRFRINLTKAAGL